jgi:hypothetical protein
MDDRDVEAEEGSGLLRRIPYCHLCFMLSYKFLHL